MEERIFRLPDVGRVLKQSYVEARLHTDGAAHLERIRSLQAELTGSLATPIYVVQDPEDGSVLGKFEGATFDGTEFAGFLEEALTRLRR
jgi:hypothetical protein